TVVAAFVCHCLDLSVSNPQLAAHGNAAPSQEAGVVELANFVGIHVNVARGADHEHLPTHSRMLGDAFSGVDRLSGVIGLAIAVEQSTAEVDFRPGLSVVPAIVLDHARPDGGLVHFTLRRYG